MTNSPLMYIPVIQVNNDSMQSTITGNIFKKITLILLLKM